MESISIVFFNTSSYESGVEIKCANCFQLETHVPILIIKKQVYWKFESAEQDFKLTIQIKIFYFEEFIYL